MYQVKVHDERPFSEAIDTEDIVVQINIHSGVHEWTPEEIFATDVKAHYAMYYPHETYIYENRCIYRIEIDKPLRISSGNFVPIWVVGTRFTKTLVAELTEVQDG